MIRIKENIELYNFTTFGIGGTARFFVCVKNREELIEAIKWSKKNNIDFIILSGGSNVLFNNRLFDLLVINIGEGDLVFEEGKTKVFAGCSLLGFINKMAELGYGGMEYLAGIPGSIGGAVRGNAGAFGSEIKDFVENVHVIDSENLQIKSFGKEECRFDYRESFFKKNPKFIIFEVEIFMEKKNKEEIKYLISKTIQEREKRHLQNVKAAGSFFMNPIAPKPIVDLFENDKNIKSKNGRVPAGWLIEKSGLKGFSVGGAISSDMHPNYIVNKSGASFEDVIELSKKIKKEVREKYNTDLIEEVSIFD